MSKAANPNKRKTQLEIEADVAVKKQDADRERIRRCIITLGDENRKVVAQIRAGVLSVEDVELHNELITTTVLDCAKCLPTKLGIYAAWCAKMAEKHPKWAVAMINKTMEDLGTCVQAGHFVATQLLLRFLVFLANTGVLGVVAVSDLLLQVVGLSEGLQANAGDFAVFAALAQLPFFSSAAYGLGKERIQKLIALGEKHRKATDAKWKPALRIFKSQDSLDRLEELLHAVKKLSKESWSVQVVHHMPGFSPSTSGMPGMPEISLAVAPEQFRQGGVKLQVPLMSARLLTADPHEGEMSQAERWVVEDYILLVVEMFAQDVQECSKQILRIPVLHPDFEAIAVETLFSQLLRLPAPSFLPLFYCRLLEACAEKQTSMVKLIDEAFQSLFRKLADMDDQCLDQLAEIFACHLANTAYQADWKIFAGEAVNPQTKHFACRALDCLQQLSEYQNMLSRLPQAMCAYAPPEPLPASGLPVVSKPQFGRFINLIRLKDANAEKVLRYCDWLMKSVDKSNATSCHGNGTDATAEESAQGDGQPPSKRPKLSAEAEEFGEAPAEPLALEEVAGLVMSVMLQHGHKTPTHMAKVLDGNEQVLLKLKPSEADSRASFEQVLVKSVFEFWKASGLRLEITLDSLIQRKVISPEAVAKYALSHELGHSNYWNVVKQVARKSLERSQVARIDLNVAKKLGKEDVLDKCQVQLDEAIQADERLFMIIFNSIVRGYEDTKDATLRGTLLARIMSLARKHIADIKTLVDTAESQIPRVRNNPDIAAVFKLVSTLA